MTASETKQGMYRCHLGSHSSEAPYSVICGKWRLSNTTALVIFQQAPHVRIKQPTHTHTKSARVTQTWPHRFPIQPPGSRLSSEWHTECSGASHSSTNPRPTRPGTLQVRHHTLPRFLGWGLARECDELVVTHAERGQRYSRPCRLAQILCMSKVENLKKNRMEVIAKQPQEKVSKRVSPLCSQLGFDMCAKQTCRWWTQVYKPLWCSLLRECLQIFVPKCHTTATSCYVKKKVLLVHLKSSRAKIPPSHQHVDQGSCHIRIPRETHNGLLLYCMSRTWPQAEWVARERQQQSLSNLPRNAF